MYPGKLLRLLQPGKTFTKISIFCHNNLFSLFRSRRSASSCSRRSCNQGQWARKASFSVLQS